MRVGSVDGHSKTEFEANSRSLDCVPRPRFARDSAGDDSVKEERLTRRAIALRFVLNQMILEPLSHVHFLSL